MSEGACVSSLSNTHLQVLAWDVSVSGAALLGALQFVVRAEGCAHWTPARSGISHPSRVSSICFPTHCLNIRSLIMSIIRRVSVPGRVSGRRSRGGHRRPARFLPWFHALEERTLLSNILTVTNTQDSGDGSLRAEVAAAHAGDTIVFSPKLDGQTITLTSGPILDTGTSLTIQGPGAALLTVSGNNQSGIFNLEPTDASQPPFAVSISGLTLAHAAGPDTSPSYAINDTNASLTLDGVAVVDNQSGGVSVASSYTNLPNLPPPYTINVNVTNSAFLDNQSDQPGAAIVAASVVFNLSQSLFEGNSDSSFGGGTCT